MKKFLLFFLLPLQVSAQQNSLQNGDLLFININCGPMCEAINAVTEGYKDNDFNHMGLVVSENNSDFFVYEAIGETVVKTPLQNFLAYTKNTVYTGSVKAAYQHLIPAALSFCKSQLGTPYDNDFLYDNGKYYCSELIYDAFKSANAGQPFFQLFPMTYKEPGSDSFFPVWTEHFAGQGISIPEGKPGCNPGGISLDNKINISVFRFSE